MPRISTKGLNPSALGETEGNQIYNALDCCITFEVGEKLGKQIQETNNIGPKLIYDFERGMQAPALEMMLRGFRVDEYERRMAIEKLRGKLKKVESILDRFAFVVWGKGLNPNSPKQMQEFLYGAMKLPEVWLSFRGVRRLTVNREALEKLTVYMHAIPIINCVTSIRDIRKKLSVLETEISPDGRFRTSYNVAATETGRWNSSSDAFGEGGNLQNITVELRKVFIADEGKKLFHLDLEQAESRVVGLVVYVVTGDDSYLRACESGDLHTTVAKLLWPTIVKDKDSAEQLFYRHFSYRDMSKRGGHASNYRVTPFTMTRHLKIGMDLAESFQRTYFTTFPGIQQWHIWTAQQLGLHQELITPLGRRRTFFGRPDDDATLREAIAYIPQSCGSADLLNLILWRIWNSGLPVELLTQEHDGLTFQFPDEPGIEAKLIPRIRDLARVQLTYSLDSTRRECSIVIPCDISTGWNWATGEKPPFLNTNPNGLRKWRGVDDRKRLEGLDRIVS